MKTLEENIKILGEIDSLLRNKLQHDPINVKVVDKNRVRYSWRQQSIDADLVANENSVAFKIAYTNEVGRSGFDSTSFARDGCNVALCVKGILARIRRIEGLVDSR